MGCEEKEAVEEEEEEEEEGRRKRRRKRTCGKMSPFCSVDLDVCVRKDH